MCIPPRYVQIQFASSDPSATLSSAYTFSATDNSSHVFVLTLVTAGGQTLTAKDASNSSLFGIGDINIIPASFDPSQSMITVTPSAVTWGGTATLTLVVRDQYGNQELTGGLSIALSLGAGSGNGSISSITDNNNRTYSATFTSTALGSKQILGVINSQIVTSTTPIVTVIVAAPILSLNDAGGTYTGYGFSASVAITGVGTNGTPSPSLEGVAPTLIYYDGIYTSVSQLAGLKGSASPPVTVGNYTVLASFSGSADYGAAPAVTSFTIAPATPIVVVNNSGGVYKSSPYPASATVSGVGSSTEPASSLEGISPTLVYYSGSAPTGTPLVGAPSNAGTYTVLASFPGSNDYGLANSNTTFTITPATLTVTAAAIKAYGQSFIDTGVISGIQGSDTITATYSSLGDSPTAAPGRYFFTASLSDGGSGKLAQNYTISTDLGNVGTLTVETSSNWIDPSSIGFNWDSASQTYCHGKCYDFCKSRERDS